jgi:hypothetical protein
MRKSVPAPAAPPSPPQAAPVTADYLAWLRAKSVGAGILAAGVLAGGGLVVDATGLAVVLVPFVAVAVVLAVYGVALWLHVNSVTRDLWRRELRDGKDYTGDGHLGPPQGHVVHVQGQPAFVLPDLHPETPAAPPPALIHFPCTANDVLFVLDKAQGDGLGFRAWEGQRLPSGVKLDRDGVKWLQDGMLAWKFATSRMTATGRRVELRTDIDIEAMKAAVQKGAAKP